MKILLTEGFCRYFELCIGAAVGRLLGELGELGDSYLCLGVLGLAVSTYVTKGRVLRRGVQLLAACIPYFAVWVGVYVTRNAWVAAGLYHFGIASYLSLTGQGGVFREFFRGWNIRLLVGSCAVFSLAGVVILVMWRYALRPDVELSGFLSGLGIGGWRYGLFAGLFCVANPILEEAFWRGCFVDRVRRLSWVDFAFAGYHVPVMLLVIDWSNANLAFVVLLCASWWLRYLRARTGGMAVGLVAHFFADASILSATFLLLRCAECKQ